MIRSFDKNTPVRTRVQGDYIVELEHAGQQGTCSTNHAACKFEFVAPGVFPSLSLSHKINAVCTKQIGIGEHRN